MFQAKKATRKMTNHRAVSWSCMALFVMERVLSQLLNPLDNVPVRHAVSGGRKVPANTLPWHLPDVAEVTLDPHVVHHYQKIGPGRFIRHSSGYYMVRAVLQTTSGVRLVSAALEIPPGGNGVDTLTRLPRLRLTGRDVMIPLQEVQYTCAAVREVEGIVVITLENK